MSIGECSESICGSIRGATRCKSIHLVEPGNGSIVEYSLDAGDMHWRSLTKSTLASGLPTRVAPALMEPGGGSIVERSLNAGGIPCQGLAKRALANTL
jgi:hypothetical protein